jgi:hypothetical protein
MTPKNFTLYLEIFRLIDTIKPKEKRNDFLGKLLDFYFKEEKPKFEENSYEEIIWENISKPIKSYKSKVVNGSKGGRPRKTENKTEIQSESDSESKTTSDVNVNVYVNNNVDNILELEEKELNKIKANIEILKDSKFIEFRKTFRKDKKILEIYSLYCFEEFWKSYPKKRNKEETKKWYLKHPPSEETRKQILLAIAFFKNDKQWENSQYIPYPSTFLNQKRWEDIK